MTTLPKIERSTELHTQQLAGVLQRTTALESAVSEATGKIRKLDDEVATLKSVVEKQKNLSISLKNTNDDLFKKNEATMTEMENMKQEFEKTTTATIAEMNELIQKQRDQIQSFNEQTKSIKRDMLTEVEGKMVRMSKETKNELHEKINKVEDQCNYNSLKSKANQNRQNLVITGLKEDKDKTPWDSAKDFLSNTLKIKDLQYDVAYRLGAAPSEESSYARPLVVRFNSVAHRDKVWKHKIDITDEDGQRVRIHADLPKRLRADSQLLHRVQRAASGMAKYKSARVKDYKFLLHGKEYAPNQLEDLPEPIRPSTLAMPKSDSTLAFFSRHSVFSNHYQSKFTVKGKTFHNMEQFLAYRKALYMDKDQLASEAMETRDPVEAKAILNKLKNGCPREWYEQAPKIAAEGIREKFKQNQYLFDILISTRGLQLGEASRDTTWGIGMTLTDPQVLDHTKWHPKGNLLGRTLMKVREEFRAKASSQDKLAKQKNKVSPRK